MNVLIVYTTNTNETYLYLVQTQSKEELDKLLACHDKIASEDKYIRDLPELYHDNMIFDPIEHEPILEIKQNINLIVVTGEL